MQYALCNIQYALCIMHNAICAMKNASAHCLSTLNWIIFNSSIFFLHCIVAQHLRKTTIENFQGVSKFPVPTKHYYYTLKKFI